VSEAKQGPSALSLTLVSIGFFLAGTLSAACVILAFPTPGNTRSTVYAIVALLAMASLHSRPRRNVAAAGSVESIHLDEVLFVPVLLMLTPWQAVAVIGFGSLWGGLMMRRSLIKSVFNVGQIILATAAAVTFVRLAGVETTTSPTLYEAIIGMIGGLILTVITALCVAVMVSYATVQPFSAIIRINKGRLVPWIGAVTLGGLGALGIGVYPWAAVLVLGVVAFVHRSYAASVVEAQARRHSENVQEAIVTLRTHTDPEDVRKDLIETAKGLLGAGHAEIVGERSLDSARSYSVPLIDGERLRVDQRLGGEQWDDRDRDTLLTLAGVAGDVLRSAELIARLRTITNSQSEGVIALDMQTRVTFANPAAVHMLGCNSDEEVLGSLLRDKLTLRHRRIPIDFASMVEGQFVAQDADATLGPPDGETLDIAYSITPLRAEGAHVGAVLVLRDVTERRAFQDELTRRALHDELTGLPNRRLLLERLDHALARSSSTGLNHGLLFLDLDRFKLVNDSYGHLIGDKLLIQVGRRLESALAPGDSVARMSGDEFIVLVEDVTEMQAVTDVAERLLQMLQEPFQVDGHHIFMSASIGVGLTQVDQGRDDILAAIDAATYAAKAAGRNCYTVSTDASVDEARARLDLEVSLRHGLDEDELELHYQPIVTAVGGEVVAVEALVRWRSPQRGVLWPQQFVPVAEETGLIVPMGRWVLEEACRDIRAWTLAHPDRPPLSVSVNLSALQFAQHRLAEDVAETLRVTGLPAHQLCLEITETVLMSDTAGTQSTLDDLHALGVSVAIDDFGTGYSSLSYLKKFAIDVVKLDRTFIEGLVTDPVDAEIASAVIRLSAALDIKTVAEGVETDSQRQMLAELGCPLIQGYLTARPLAAPDFLAFWDNTVAGQEQSQAGSGLSLEPSRIAQL
jgi:diguanylate cyclase (GGDEF)-like protein/PAS domain S-box-containing protein